MNVQSTANSDMFDPVTIGSITFKELVSQVPQSDIDLLAELSLLDSFTFDEASLVSSHPDSKRRIGILEQRKFLSVISDAPKRFQINSLIQDDCRTLLSNNPTQFKNIALKSAKALEVKYPLKALELYGLAGNIASATNLIMSNLQHFLLQGDMELVLEWAPAVSHALGGGRNREKAVKAYGLLGTGKFEQVKSTLREIESDLTNSVERAEVVQEIEPINLYLDFFFGNFDKVDDTAEAKVKSKRSSTLSQTQNGSFIHRAHLISYFYIQDSKGFSKYFKAKNMATFAAHSPIDQVYINSFKAMSAFLTGRYLEANEYAYASCRIAEELGVEGSYFPFEAAFILMDTHLEFGDEKKSEQFVDKYLPKAIRFNQYPWIAAFYAKAALIKAQSGRFQASLLLIRKGRESVESTLFGPNITFVLDVHELVIRLPLGDLERINELLFRLSSSKAIESFKVALEIMQNPSKVDQLSKKMASKTDQDKFRKELMLATALVGNKSKAIKHLENAIAYAVPNGYFRAFLNLPPIVRPLILDLAAAKPTIYLENLARAIRNQSIHTSSDGANLERQLTKKELIILRRLDSGLPVTQIADDLSISKNTIKTHLKNIYRKLAAVSRHDAVTKAKELLLL